MLAGWQHRGAISGFRGSRACGQKGARVGNENLPGGGGRIKFWEGGGLAQDEFLNLAGGREIFELGIREFFGAE